jgi:hypothetical protein
MNDPSPRLNRRLPDPDGETAAAYEMRLLIDRISRVPARIGISDAEAVNVGSDPNRIYAKFVDVLVTTTESPPPDNGTLADAAPTDTLTVPVGRKGLTEPSGIAFSLGGRP